MIYKWKSACYIKGDPQVAGEVCEELSDKGKLTPANLVDVSRPDDAPLHDMFTWSDDVAAERWRQHEARHIIQCLVSVVGSDEQEPVRAYVSLESGESTRSYKRIDVVLKEADSRQMMLLDAKRDMLAFQRKYRQLSELSDVFKAMGEFVGSLLEEEVA